MTRTVITLTTDFGSADHLVGTMKGVILNINPDVEIVDITHSVLPYDLLDGALAIGQAYKYFPPKTVHVVVVDPGVGTDRRPLLVSAGTQYFVAPDNGVLSMIYAREESLTVRHVTSEHYFLQPMSTTFHGRDVFSPVAAWLSKNWQTQSFGEEVTDFVRFTLPKPKAGGQWREGRGAAGRQFRELTDEPRSGGHAASDRGNEVQDACRKRGDFEVRADLWKRRSE